MLALALYRASRCPVCGRDIHECTDVESDGRWDVPPPTRCHATTAISMRQQEYADAPQPEALLYQAVRR